MIEDGNKSLRGSLIELGCTHQLSRLQDRESHQLSSQPVVQPKPTIALVRTTFEAESHGHCRSRIGVRHTSGASCVPGVFGGWAAV